MKRFTFLFSTLFFILFSSNVYASGVDSLNITSKYITLGESFYTDYFTGYYVYTNTSFFKDENGKLHGVFISNYELYYCTSIDSGYTWSSDHILSTHDGDFRRAVIYADEDGIPYIACTVNPYFNYGNPTGIEYGDEFRYNVYVLFLEEDQWVEELVFNSTINTGFSGNFGCMVDELYKDLNNDLILIGHRYGWYTYGGELWEFKRDTSETWSEYSIIQGYSDTPVDHTTSDCRSYLKANGERDLIYTRPYNASGVTELVSKHFNGIEWSVPTVLTEDLINHAAWDLSIGSAEEMYLIHYNNEPSPHVNMYTDFVSSVELDLDFSLVDTIQTAKIHATQNGLLDLIVYPLNTDTVVLYVSEDFGVTWGEPFYLSRKIFPGTLPITDQFSNQGTDLEFLRVSRVSTVEPFGPDSLYYGHVEQVNTTYLGIVDYKVLESNLSVYPNPFTEELTVEYFHHSASEVNVKIYNLQGKVVMNRDYSAVPGKTMVRIYLGDLDAGTYIFEIYDSENTRRSVKKILKLPNRNF